MALFDELSNVVNRGIGGTERMLEVGRLKTQMLELTKRRDELMMAAGRSAYSLHRRNPLGIPELDDVFERIQEVGMQVVAIEDRIAEVQKTVDAGERCTSCGQVSPSGAAYCVSCGEPISKPVGRACPSCATLVPDNAEFCVRCGARMQT